VAAAVCLSAIGCGSNGGVIAGSGGSNQTGGSGGGNQTGGSGGNAIDAPADNAPPQERPEADVTVPSPDVADTNGCPTMPVPGACAPPLDIRCPYPKLSQTGCMDPTDPLKMAAAVVPYEVNSPLWSDGALKTRGMKLPAGKKIHVKDCAKNADECKEGDPYNYPNFLPPYDDGKWVFPVGTVMVKSFMFPDTGLKSGMKVVETRLFVHFDDKTWVGYAYQWNEAQTEATIVSDFVNDLETQATFNVMTAAGKKAITWNYPSRADCMLCHAKTENNVVSPHIETGGSVLGPETAQMNRMVLAANGVDKVNQIDKLKALDLFDVPPPMPYKAALAVPYAGQAGMPAANATLDQRARSYLHANCSFCHRPDSVFYYMDLRNDVPLKSSYLCNVAPEKGDLGVMDALRLIPGDPMKSVMWLRMMAAPEDMNGKHGRMPPKASFVVDTDGAALVSNWIKQLPKGCGP
jgi:hypothetical protein